MDKRFKEAFEKIHAEERLTHKTAEVLLTEAHKRKNRKVYPRLVSICVVLSVLLVPLILYFTPGAYVDMDVNPSIALTLNRFGRVLEASAYNGDGGEILRSVDVRHMMYVDASGVLLNAMIERGYLAEDGLISITVRAEEGLSEQEMLEGLRETVAVSLAAHHLNADSELYAVSREIQEEATGRNVSPAKYIAISELREVDETATFEGCMHHSIHEIRRMIEDHSNGIDDDYAEDESSCPDHSNGPHHGRCRH